MNRKRARLGYRPSLLKRRDREGGKEREDKRNTEVSSNPKPLPSTEHRTDADGRERPLMNDRRTASSSSPSLSWTDGRTDSTGRDQSRSAIGNPGPSMYSFPSSPRCRSVVSATIFRVPRAAFGLQIKCGLHPTSFLHFTIMVYKSPFTHSTYTHMDHFISRAHKIPLNAVLIT